MLAEHIERHRRRTEEERLIKGVFDKAYAGLQALPELERAAGPLSEDQKKELECLFNGRKPIKTVNVWDWYSLRSLQRVHRLERPFKKVSV